MDWTLPFSEVNQDGTNLHAERLIFVEEESELGASRGIAFRELKM